MRADESFEVSRVSSDDDNMNAADKRGVEPPFRLGRRRSSAGSEQSAEPAVARSPSTSPTFRLGGRSDADRRSTTFRLGRRSAYQPNPSSYGSAAYDNFVSEWWPDGDYDIRLYKKDADDYLTSADAPPFRLGKRGDSQPTFRLGRSNPPFRLGKRSSTNPTFRLGKRDS